VFQGFQSANDGFDMRAGRLVLVHERGALSGDGFLAGPQGAILIAQQLDLPDQFVDAFFELLEFLLNAVILIVMHIENYGLWVQERSMSTCQFWHNFRMESVDYTAMQRILSQAGALTDAPEAHGTLAGAFCSADDYRFESWLAELFADGSAAGEPANVLREMFDRTRASLHADDLRFVAVLPDDEEPLAARAEALGQWCQGFLYGLGTNPIPHPDSLPEDVAEVVRDLSSIVQVGVDETQDEEANESAYAELVEFVRVGVQLLFEELAPYRAANAPAPKPDASLH
jgi:uncharacterized protein YgfB (UPF0149 family)